MDPTPTPDPSLRPFFDPAGVAIVGVSTTPTKLGYGLARNLVLSGYRGAIHFVNPRGGRLLGHEVRLTIADVPDPLDLAVLLVPAPQMPEALAEAGRRGVRAAILASGGFRETGPEGLALEQACLRVAADYGMRLVGPNCVGLLDTHRPLDTTFLPPPGPTPGDIAFISHSGAICEVVIDWSWGQGFGLSRLASLGNQIDVTEADMLPLVATDPHTRVITMYLEGVGDGRAFVRAAAATTPHKPVIALKVGRTRSGQQAAASHTGALAGTEAAFDAAFRRAGVIRATTTEEMFDWARMLALAPRPAGRRVAVLTNAGGPGVTATDALEAHGLVLAAPSPQTTEALRALLPPSAGLDNPVDMLASATAGQYAAALRLLLDDPGVDSVMVLLPPPPMESAGAVARATIPVIHTTDKPVVAVLMGDRLIREAEAHYRAAGVPEYRFPERAAAALAVLSDRADFLARPPAPETATLTDIDAEAAFRILEQAAAAPGDWLSPETATALLEAYAIRVPAARTATSADEAAAAASILGFPVALKIDSADIPHKSDIGGVVLGLPDEAAVRQGFETIMANARAAAPEARLQGVVVQQMVGDGQEVIVGAVRDAQFGPLIMFGSGGVEVEGLGDVAFALAPVPPDEAAGLLDHTWAGRKLAGFRGLPPADAAAAQEVIVRLGRLAADLPALAEIEINPLRVLARGRGAVAIDVRGRLIGREELYGTG